MNRLAGTGLVLAGLTLAAAAVLMPERQGFAQPVRQSFDILTGPAGGRYFPIGELIARAVSHPPGLVRCEKKGVCAPPGIIVSARSSDGAIANVLAVNQGSAASGLAHTTIVTDALAGRGPFRKQGRQTRIRVMADLFAEAVQLVVASRSDIHAISDLRGKRISLGSAGSGGDVIAAAILSGSGVRNTRLRRESADASVSLLRQGRIDAFFFLGNAPSPGVADLVARGTARLVPIGGKARARVLSRVAGLSAGTIPAGTYRGAGAIDTVSVRTLWIANDGAPAETVYGLVRALYNPANRALLEQGPRAARDIRLGQTASFASLPLHAGAARYYREMVPTLGQAQRR